VATIYNDQLAIAGSLRVWRPAMLELHELGLFEIRRFAKKYAAKPSERWRAIDNEAQARLISARPRWSAARRLPGC
jgi:hypothetical protein